MIIVAKINALEIDKTKLKKGSYKTQRGEDVEFLHLSLVLIPAKGKNHYIVKQGTDKDDDTEMPIIGSANEFGKGAKPSNNNQAPNNNNQSSGEDMPW